MKFNYLARTKDGETQTGTIKAPDQTAALKVLHGNDLVILKLKSSEKAFLLTKRIKFFEKVKRKEVFIFFRQLAILIEADVPLIESLRALGQQTDNPAFEETLFNIANDVDGGTSFSKALAKYPKVFSNFCVNLIKTGEVSGRLQESLIYLSNYLEKEYYLVSRVRGAMIYPAFIFATFMIVGVLVLVMVIPQLTSILIESGQDLPIPTKIIIAASDFVRGFGWIVVIALLIGGGFLWRYLKTSKGKFFWDRLVLRIPIFGKILQKTYLARLADTLYALIKGGVPIIEGLTISGNVVGNIIFRKILEKAKEGVKAGKSISSELDKHKQFPPLFCQMIRTGEKTGKLNMVLEKLSDFYNKEVENIVNNLSQLIEPVLIVVLAIGVAVLVFAVFMPIYNLAGAF
ncbi:MAG: type II secretion system F family protein [Patescibacteria group bacterium]|nr:type II secretion system F family protein [Patescibacteria group bacterium]